MPPVQKRSGESLGRHGSAIYDWSKDEDRFRYATNLLTKNARRDYLNYVEKHYGEDARQKLLEDLHEFARRTGRR